MSQPPIKKKRGGRMMPMLVFGTVCSTIYTFTHDYLIPRPNKEKYLESFKNKQNRQIVVLGADVIGMTTAYYLS